MTRKIDILGIILRYEWLILALLAVPMLFPRPAFTPLFLILPLLWALHWRRSGSPFPATPLNFPLLLLGVMLLGSLWATFSIEFSLLKISGLLFSLAVFFAVECFSEKRIELAIAGFLLGGLAVAVLGLFGTAWPAKIAAFGALGERLPLWIQGLPAAESGIHPNELGGVLTLFLPLAIIALLRGKIKTLPRSWLGKALLLVFVLLLGGVMLLTQSRSAFIGLACGLALLLAGGGRRGRIVLAVLGVAALIIIFQIGVPTLLGLNEAETINPVGEITFASRFEIWSRALYGLQDFSFTGMGMGTFRRVAPVLYPFFMISPEKDVAHAHNIYLQTGLDLGLPGLIAYISLWIGSFAMLLIVYNRRSEDKIALGMDARTLALGLAGGLLAHGVYGLTDAVALGAKPGFLWWWLLGLVAGLYKISAKRLELAASN
ncbi:MAG: O-antigen ligase family protein [Anaerolineales bacterium]